MLIIPMDYDPSKCVCSNGLCVKIVDDSIVEMQ